MIIDYKLNAKSRPSEREVWLMSKRAQDDGFKVTMSMMRAMATGEIKYYEGVFYKLCRNCMDYKPIEEFYSNKRYIMDVGYVCRDCMAIRRRVKAYGVPSYISDVGMKDVPLDVRIRVKPEVKEALERRLAENGLT